MQNAKLKSHFQLHLIVFIWGFTAVLGALISVAAVPLVWHRMFLASLLVFLWIKWKKIKIRLSRKSLIRLIFAGIIIALHWLSFFGAIKVSNVSITLAIMATGALFTAILEPIFFRRKLIGYELLFGMLVIVGLFIIFRVEKEYSLGIALALIASFLGSVFTIINGKMIKKETAAVISFYELFVGMAAISVYLFFLNIAGDPGQGFTKAFFELSLRDGLLLFILASVCTAYAFIGSVQVMKYLSPYTVMLTTNLEPVYGILLALIILGSDEKMTPGFYAGALLILGTVILNGILKTRRKINNKQKTTF